MATLYGSESVPAALSVQSTPKNPPPWATALSAPAGHSPRHASPRRQGAPRATPRRQSAPRASPAAPKRPKSLPRGAKAPPQRPYWPKAAPKGAPKPPPRYPSAPRATPRRQSAAAETVLAQGRPKRRPKLTLPLCPRRPPAGASPRRQYGLCADVVRRRSPMPLGHPTGAASYPAPLYPLLQRLHPAGPLPSPPTFPRRPTPLKPPAPYPAPAHLLLQRLHPAG